MRIGTTWGGGHELKALYMLNPMVQVSWKNIDHKWSYDHLGRYTCFSENAHFGLKFALYSQGNNSTQKL